MVHLNGKRILLVEDEAILALSIEDMLRSVGCIVVGPALSVAEGQALAQTEKLDAAILDINMGDGKSFAVAEVLRLRNVPFCFSTGYGAAGVPPEYAQALVLAKPYSERCLANVLQALIDQPSNSDIV